MAAHTVMEGPNCKDRRVFSFVYYFLKTVRQRGCRLAAGTGLVTMCGCYKSQTPPRGAGKHFFKANGFREELAMQSCLLW